MAALGDTPAALAPGGRLPWGAAQNLRLENVSAEQPTLNFTLAAENGTSARRRQGVEWLGREANGSIPRRTGR